MGLCKKVLRSELSFSWEETCRRPWKIDFPLLLRSESFANMSLKMLICPYYYHILCNFQEKWNQHQRFTWKFDLSVESLAEILAKILKFWWCHLKNRTITIISNNVTVFRGGSAPATSKIELFVKRANGF